jgi:hypothetical protein
MDLFKDIFGDEQPEDRISRILRKQTPVIGAGRPGAIPTQRPTTTPSQRKQEIKQLCEQSLAQTNFNEQTMTSLVEAMSSYVENAIGQAGKV